MLARLNPMFFDPNVDPIVTAKTPPPGKDILTASANNLYSDVSLADLKGFTEKYGLNSRLVKQPNGKLVEEVYRVGGRYSKEITEVVRTSRRRFRSPRNRWPTRCGRWSQFYRTGEKADREKYDIAWVNDKASTGGHDQRLHRGVSRRARRQGRLGRPGVLRQPRRRPSASASSPTTRSGSRTSMPYDAKFRKPMVKGIVANAIDVVVETGDSGPVTPIGINLPNDQAIREQHGSKSVSLSNVGEAERQGHAGHRCATSSRGRPRKPSAAGNTARWRASSSPTCTR